jgi:hypothetical protein
MWYPLSRLPQRRMGAGADPSLKEMNTNSGSGTLLQATICKAKNNKP